MTASDKIKEVKRLLFGDAVPPPPAAAPAMPAAPADATVFAYAVDGSTPIYVNASDDGIADIDAGDTVYADEAMTMPYPDGSYKVTGTDFGFTVSGGKVTNVDDAAGTGAGMPMDAAKTNPLVSPIPPAAPHNPAPAPADLSQFKADFAAMQTDFKGFKEIFATVQTDFAAAKETIGKQQQAIEGLLSIVEKLAATPVAEPPAPPQNFRADKKDRREARLEAMVSAIKDIKK